MLLSYKKQLLLLQIELVKLQRHFIQCNNRILVIVEGRDAAGKDGMIKRIAEHLSPRETRIVALGKPSDKEKSSWYFQRFVSVIEFEHMLIRSGISLFKYYLDISRDEQASRLQERKLDPLKQWKISPIDEQALQYFDEYSAARDIMLQRTHNETSPWTVVNADNKRDARLHMISDLLARLTYTNKDESVLLPGKKIVKRYNVNDKKITKNH
jgi:polyphosphate kinase 2 (PPK2 family)